MGDVEHSYNYIELLCVLYFCISGHNTDLSNRFASRVADCNFLTEGKSETVVMAIWDNNTLNTPYKSVDLVMALLSVCLLSLPGLFRLLLQCQILTCLSEVILLLESVGPVGELYN